MKLPYPLVSSMDPAMAGFLAQGAQQPPMHSLPPPVVREIVRQLSTMPGPPAAAVAEVRDLALPTAAGPRKLRLYTPRDIGSIAPKDSGQAAPLLLFLHGGGYVFGDLDGYDWVCRGLCHESGMRVASLDYRLAPEHPFPAALDDAEAALRWLHTHAADLGCHPMRLAVAGDSAGAQLSAAAAIRVAGDVPLAGVGMIYPVVHALGRPTQSKQENGEGKLLTNELMRWATEHYVGTDPARQAHPEVALLPAAQLSALPPCWVATLGHDPLRDDGLDLVATLGGAGIPVRHCHEPSGVHGCLTMPALSPVGPRLVSALASWLRETV